MTALVGLGRPLMRVQQLSGMGPANHQVLAFVKKVFKPAKVRVVKPEAYEDADVLVCGDWRIHRDRTSEPGGDVLAGVLDRGRVPATLIYALLGKTELGRALKRRARGVSPVEGWRRVVKGGGRVIVLQLDRLGRARKPFTVVDAIAALATISPKHAVLWHDPAKPISAV